MLHAHKFRLCLMMILRVLSSSCLSASAHRHNSADNFRDDERQSDYLFLMHARMNRQHYSDENDDEASLLMNQLGMNDVHQEELRELQGDRVLRHTTARKSSLSNLVRSSSCRHVDGESSSPTLYPDFRRSNGLSESMRSTSNSTTATKSSQRCSGPCSSKDRLPILAPLTLDEHSESSSSSLQQDHVVTRQQRHDQVSTGKPEILIEVEPGVHMPLTGDSDSTWRAIQNAQAAFTACWSCEASLFCHPHVAVVLCPDCRVLSPLHSSDSKAAPTSRGVGLGVHVDQCCTS